MLYNLSIYLIVQHFFFMDSTAILKKYYFWVLTLLFVCSYTSPSYAQLFSIGYKQHKSGMFHTTFNHPLIFDNNKPYELMLGADYTTKNKHMPSGLAPQASFMYYIDGDRRKDYLIGTGLHTGYLFDFNKQFKNQTRVTPFFYYEYIGLVNLKIGYDYMLPSNKGYPFISIGIGGLMMFKDFSLF